LNEFGIEFVPKEPYWRTTFYSIQSEKAGFDYLWITDHFNNRNVYVTLSLAATYTDKIRLGPGVTNPYMVHPVITAQAVASLDEIAPGRVICGLGVGDKTTLEMMSVPQRNPLATMREAVAVIRGMCRGDPLRHDGEIYNIDGARFLFGVKHRIPIFVGAQGPKMLGLAAELGDGVLINASHPADVGSAKKFVDEGMSRSGKKPSELAVAVYTSFSIDSSEKSAVKAALPVVAYIVAGCPPAILERHGIEEASAASIKDLIVHERWKEAFSAVTPEMIEAFCVCGTPEKCTEKISELLKLGVTQFVVGSPIGPNIRRSVDLVGREILPRFR